VPLAQALKAAGHEVVFATGRRLQPAVEATGFRYFPAGLEFALFAEIAAERMIVDLLSLCRITRPDIVVRDVTEFGGCIAAERLGIPHATVQVGSQCPPESPWHAIEPELARLRHSFDLPPDPHGALLYRYLHLSFVPPTYQKRGAFLPTTTQSLRPVIFDRYHTDALPAWIAHLPKHPTIYATLGTISNLTPGILSTIIAGLRGELINLILTIGHNHDPATFGLQPPNVHIERYIPQTLLLPYCDLVITHGGFNTVLAALSHGLPMVVVPLFADQPENARRCAALGVGRVITPAQLTPDTVRDVAYEVWRNPKYREHARYLQAEMQSLPGPEYAVRLLEQLVIKNQRPAL